MKRELNTSEITGIEIIVTEGCNLRCKYCYQNKTNVNFVDEETQDSIIKFLEDNPNVTDISLFGGEPMLPSNADVLYRFLSRISNIRSFSISITTNGFSVNDNVLDVYRLIDEKFKDLKIQFSIDGTKEIHDENRVDLNGNGTYDKVVSNIQTIINTLNKINKMVIIHHVITPSNVNKVDTIILNDAELLKTTAIDHISFKPEHTGEMGDFNEVELKEMFIKAFDLYVSGRVPFKCVQSFVNHQPLTKVSNDKHLCGAMCTYITIKPNGDLIPCHLLAGNPSNNHKYYNINTKEDYNDEIVDIIENCENVEYKSSHGYDCKSCIARNVCTICMIGNFKKYNDISINEGCTCTYYKTLVDAWCNYCDSYTEITKDDVLAYCEELLSIYRTYSKMSREHKIENVRHEAEIMVRLFKLKLLLYINID